MVSIKRHVQNVHSRFIHSGPKLETANINQHKDGEISRDTLTPWNSVQQRVSEWGPGTMGIPETPFIRRAERAFSYHQALICFFTPIARPCGGELQKQLTRHHSRQDAGATREPSSPCRVRALVPTPSCGFLFLLSANFWTCQQNSFSTLRL